MEKDPFTTPAMSKLREYLINTKQYDDESFLSIRSTITGKYGINKLNENNVVIYYNKISKKAYKTKETISEILRLLNSIYKVNNHGSDEIIEMSPFFYEDNKDKYRKKYRQPGGKKIVEIFSLCKIKALKIAYLKSLKGNHPVFKELEKNLKNISQKT